jgi:hypothetical protein
MQSRRQKIENTLTYGIYSDNLTLEKQSVKLESVEHIKDHKKCHTPISL